MLLNAPRIMTSWKCLGRSNAEIRTVILCRTPKGPFKNKFRFCWRLFGLLARRERRAYPQRSVRSEQRSQQAKEPQPAGAGRRRARGFVARQSKIHKGYSPSSRLASGPAALPPKSEFIFERTLSRSRRGSEAHFPSKSAMIREPATPG